VRRSPLLPCALAAALALAVPTSATAGSRSGSARSHGINASVEGAVTRTGATVVSAYLLKDRALGTGAGRLDARSASNTGKATATSTAYLPGGTLKFKLDVQFGTAANGSIPITATGTARGGTGKFEGARGSVTINGAQDTATLRFSVKITGRLRY
jgi:hemolysin activation/secretion protein